MDQEEVKRRMVAARALADFGQGDLDEAFAKAQLPKNVGKLERGERQLGDAHIDVMVRALGVPREWFEVDDLLVWINQAASVLRAASAPLTTPEFRVLAERMETEGLLERVDDAEASSDQESPPTDRRTRSGGRGGSGS